MILSPTKDFVIAYCEMPGTNTKSLNYIKIFNYDQLEKKYLLIDNPIKISSLGLQK